MWKVTCDYPNWCFVALDQEKLWEIGYVMSFLDGVDKKRLYLFFIDQNSFYSADFPWTLLQNKLGYARENNLHFKIIYLNIGEAPAYRFDIKQLCDKLNDENIIPHRDQILFSAGIKHFDDPIQIATSYNIALRKQIWSGYDHTQPPTHHFISLCRILRKQRAVASVEILDRDLLKYGYMSVGSAYTSIDDPALSYCRENFDLVPERHRHLMPMYLDGYIGNVATICYLSQNDPRVCSAFVHLVMETSYDYPYAQQGASWLVPLLSEKSFKPLVFGQIPLFLCHGDQLKYLREMDFDLFDDVIDHSYDLEPDPARRITLVVDQLEKICKQWSLDQMQRFKSDNMARFSHNRNRFIEMLALEPDLIGKPSLIKALNSSR
jgi:hypothetical protein